MHKTFHLLYPPSARGGSTIDLFKAACKKNDVSFVGHNTDALSITDLRSLGKNDLLYRVATSRRAITVERMLMSSVCTSFYNQWTNAYQARGTTSWFIHEKLGFPVIPSYPAIPVSPEELTSVVDTLGGFPIIVKVVGGSLGVGVMVADSIESLRSILDYLKSQRANVLLRKYIDHNYYVRAVVVGNRVVASNATYNIEGEFRTNVGEDTNRKRESAVLSDDTQRMVVQSVNVLGIETGGVDLLYDKEGKHYIAEVNFPHDFTMAQHVTGIDIADAMIKHLVHKSDIVKHQ